MADIDRILQLKVALDTGELAAGLDDTGSKLGTVGKQIGGFVKATGIGLALQGVELLVGKVGEGVERSQELEAAYSAMGTQLGLISQRADQFGIDPGEVENVGEIQSTLSEMSREFGFTESEMVTAFNTIAGKSQSLEEAFASLSVAMDLTRGSDELADLQAGAELLRDTIGTHDLLKLEEDFGFIAPVMEDGAEGMAKMTDTMGLLDAAAQQFGGTAKNYAETTEGMGAVIDENMVQAFAMLGDEINKLATEIMPILINDVFPAIAEVWNNPLQPALQEFQEILQTLQTFIQDTEHIWAPIIQTTADVISTAFEGAKTSIQFVVDAIEGVQQAIQDMRDFVYQIESSVRQAFASLADAIMGPLSGVADFVGGIKDTIGGILPGGSSASGVTVNQYITGDPALVGAMAVSAIQTYAAHNGTTASPMARRG